MDRASSSNARRPKFEPRPLHLKIPLLYPKPSGSLELGVWSLSCIGGDKGSDQQTPTFECLFNSAHVDIVSIPGTAREQAKLGLSTPLQN